MPLEQSLLRACGDSIAAACVLGGRRRERCVPVGKHSHPQVAARYGHAPRDANRKVAAEGIEALKEVSENLDQLLAHLIGGVQAGMGYLGAATLPDLRAKARYIRISPAGQKEAAPHDVVEMKASS